MATKTKKAFRLADVDGTIPGVAVMTIVRIDPNTPEDQVLVSVDRYVEADDRPDPQRTAEALWSSIEHDWPGCVMTLALNERARFLMANRRNVAILGEANGRMTPREYWEEYA